MLKLCTDHKICTKHNVHVPLRCPSGGVDISRGIRSWIRVPTIPLGMSLSHLVFQVWLSLMYALQTNIQKRGLSCAQQKVAAAGSIIIKLNKK